MIFSIPMCLCGYLPHAPKSSPLDENTFMDFRGYFESQWTKSYMVHYITISHV